MCACRGIESENGPRRVCEDVCVLVLPKSQCSTATPSALAVRPYATLSNYPRNPPPRCTSLHLILGRWREQMFDSRTPCLCSSGAGAGRRSTPRTPCMHTYRKLRWRVCGQRLAPTYTVHCGGCRRTAVFVKTLGHFSDRGSRVFEAAASSLANAPFNPKKNDRFIWYLEELKPDRKLKSVNLNILLNISSPKPHVATLRQTNLTTGTLLCGKDRN